MLLVSGSFVTTQMETQNLREGYGLLAARPSVAALRAAFSQADANHGQRILASSSVQVNANGVSRADRDDVGMLSVGISEPSVRP